MIAQVLPDVPAIDRVFDYAVPPELEPAVRVGTMVRIPLHGRRVGGWVVGTSDEAGTDRPLQAIAKVRGYGPPSDLVDLASWAAWRWAGPRPTFLRTASPVNAVRGLPDRTVPAPAAAPAVAGELAAEAFAGAGAVLRLPPARDVYPIVFEAARRGSALVLSPSVGQAAHLALRLKRAGINAVQHPRDWARAAAGGCTVVGARAAAWAPVPDLAAVVVVDEHDETYQEERAPTWNARDVAVERARRAGVPCVLVSPCPSLESLAALPLLTASRNDERAGWPVVEVVDRRKEAPGLGLYSARLVDVVRGGGRVVCVLNRKGRARLLACANCGELARCETCQAAVEQTSEGGLACRRCGTERPVVCAPCGATRLKTVRVGVTRAREDLERLAGRPVLEVTGDDAGPVPDAAVLVGTEAVLHRVDRADVVAFLDFDQEQLAPRYRAAEEALALLVRAARLVGGRDGGRVLVQTRVPGHEAIDAAVHADPGRLAVVEGARRAALQFPPETALALLSGDGAPAYAAALGGAGVDVLGPAAGGRFLVRAPDHQGLCDRLAAVARPSARLRVAVDPLRA